MPDLAGCSHDELIEELQKRLSQGVIGYEGLFSDNQSNAQSISRQLAEWLATQLRVWPEHSAHHQAYRTVRDRWQAIVDAEPRNERVPFRVFRINTTFLGKDNIYQDHSPKAA